MGIEALYRKPNTSKKHPHNKVYPYLLRGLKITRANHVWATDITYIPMAQGWVSRVAIVRGEKAGAHQQQHNFCALKLLRDRVSKVVAGQDAPVVPRLNQPLTLQQRQVLFKLVAMRFVIV